MWSRYESYAMLAKFWQLSELLTSQNHCKNCFVIIWKHDDIQQIESNDIEEMLESQSEDSTEIDVEPSFRWRGSHNQPWKIPNLKKREWRFGND